MINRLLIKEINNLQEIVENSLKEDMDVMTFHEIKEQVIINYLLESVQQCKGKLQTSTNPQELVTKINCYKELLKLYGVELC